MKKTLEALKLLGDRLATLRRVVEEGDSVFDDAVFNAYNALTFDLEEIEDLKQLPKEVVDKYFDLIQDFRHEPTKTLQKLINLNNQYEQEVEEDDKKLEKSIGVIGNIMQWQDDNDDRGALMEVQALMNVYEKSYDDKGALDSVDDLCKVGDALQKGLEDKKISRKTAEELMKHLVEIKEHMFDKDLVDDKMREFNESLQDVLGKDGREQGGMQQQTQSTNIITDAAVLAKNIGKAAVNIAKGIKEANRKIDEKAEKAAAEYDKNQQREMQAADVVKSAADDKRRLKEDVKTQDTKADMQGVKKHTMKSLHDTINNYKKGIAQGSVDDVRKEFVNISHEIESAVQQGVISEKLANDLIKHMRDVAGLKGDKDFIPQSPEYMGFGKRKGKDDNAQIRAQEDKELAPERADKSSKFKDGIVNVLNMQRQERPKNDDKKSTEEKRALLLKKKFLGKTVVE